MGGGASWSACRTVRLHLVKERDRDTLGWWRPLAWMVLTALALSPPQSSILAAVLIVVAALAASAAGLVESLWWRLVLLVVTAGCGIAITLAVRIGLGPVPIFIAATSMARLMPSRRVLVVAGMFLSLIFAVSVAWVSRTPWAALGGLGVPLVLARSWDREALRREHARVVSLLDELEQRRDADVRAAAADERARIARDLHDVLAHTLSGLSLQLQGIRAVLAGRSDTPQTVITSVDRAADLARTGLDEARQAVAALRTGPTTAPGTAELRALIDGHDHADLELDGPFDTLDPAVRETVFATVRESLTNAERYAPGSPVWVRVTHADGLVATIRDRGAAQPLTAGDHGGGAGLRGLAERAAAVGGTLDAHPEPGSAEPVSAEPGLAEPGPAEPGPAGAPGWNVTLRIPTPQGAPTS